MIRFFFFRLVLPLLILLFVRSLLRTIFAGIRSAAVQSRPPAAPPVPAGGELKKDPVCGTYVSTAASLSQKVEGELVYFCSKECRDKYKVAAR
jgi:YHS domain-containing protein